MKNKNDIHNNKIYTGSTYITNFFITNFWFLVMILPLILYAYKFESNLSMPIMLVLSILMQAMHPQATGRAFTAFWTR